METLQEYFARPNTPASGSPVGELMMRVLAKDPGMTFDESRAEANTLQQKAAGKWNYRIPRVLSPEEQRTQRERLRTAWTLREAA
jgi:hypothetical protein